MLLVDPNLGWRFEKAFLENIECRCGFLTLVAADLRAAILNDTSFRYFDKNDRSEIGRYLLNSKDLASEILFVVISIWVL